MLRQNVQSRQRKGGKLDPDYIGPYTVMNVDGKSIDLKDDKGHSCPKINKDHLVHFLEGYPSKVPKLSDSFPVTVSSALPNPPGYTPAASTQPPVCAATGQPPVCVSCLLTVLQNSVYYFANMHAHFNIFFFCCNELSLSLSQKYGQEKKVGHSAVKLAHINYLHGILNALDLWKCLKVR